MPAADASPHGSVEGADSAPPTPENQVPPAALKQAARLAGETVKPVSTRPTITAPDFLGGSPSMVFNQAKQWLIDHIIRIASGTTKDGEFPRIAPLFEIPEGLPYRISDVELRAIVTDIRASVRRIRPPLVESFDHLLDIADRLRKGPKDGGDIGDGDDLRYSSWLTWLPLLALMWL